MNNEIRVPPGVLMVLPWELAAIGGVNAVVANLYERFSLHGELKPTILIQSWAHTKPEQAQENGYDKVWMRIRGPVEKGNITRSLLTYLVFLPSELAKVARLVRTLRVSVVNAHYPTLAMLNFVLAQRLRLLNARLVLSLHGTDIRRAASGHFIGKLLWRWLLREVDAIVAVSEGLARTVVEFEPRVQSKIVVVHNGLDVDRFTVESGIHNVSQQHLSDRRIILTVGAFDKNKGHDILLEAFSVLAEKYRDLHLVLIGQDGRDTADVESLVEHLNLKGRCTLLKDVPREIVASSMRLATLFVLASRSEGFGLAILEAGSFGVPVVATRVGGIPEIISGPEYGVLVDPDDVSGLESAIESLLINPEAAKIMGLNFRDRVRKVFSWEEAYRKYRYAFNEIGVVFAGERP